MCNCHPNQATQLTSYEEWQTGQQTARGILVNHYLEIRSSGIPAVPARAAPLSALLRKYDYKPGPRDRDSTRSNVQWYPPKPQGGLSPVGEKHLTTGLYVN